MPATFTITESFENRRITGNLTEKTYTRRFWAVADIDDSNAGEVAAASGIPLIGDPFEGPGGFTDTGVYCSEVTVSQRNDAGPRHWVVDCSYTSRLDFAPGGTLGTPGGPSLAPGGATGPTEQATSPLLRPFKVSWGKASYTEAIIQDADGNALVNSAEDPYDPVEEPAGRLLLTIVKNQASYNPLFVRDYWNKVNQLPWAGFPANTVRCNSITAEQGQELGVSYWEVRYEFEVAEDTWDIKKLDAGFNEIVGGDKKAILLENARQPTAPVPLDGSGVKLAVGGVPVYNTFSRPKKDFADLGIFS